MRVSRLEQALSVSFGAIPGANLQAVDRIFAAAGRQGLPDVSRRGAPEPILPWIAARLAANIRRQMAPQRLEKIESAPGNGRGSEASDLQDVVHGRAAGRAGPWPPPQWALLNSRSRSRT